MTDVDREVADFIKRRTLKDVVILSHDNTRPLLPREIVDFAKEHAKPDDIPTSHYPAVPDRSHRGSQYRGNWNFRHALAEGLLRFYQGASLVVTSRLHAALPCLALGTPVLFVKEGSGLANYKFATYLPYLNHTTPEELLEKKYSFSFDMPEANPQGYKKFVERINTACTEFIAACESEEDEPKIDVETWLEAQQRNLRLKKILKMVAPGTETIDPKLVNPKLFNF